MLDARLKQRRFFGGILASLSLGVLFGCDGGDLPGLFPPSYWEGNPVDHPEFDVLEMTLAGQRVGRSFGESSQVRLEKSRRVRVTAGEPLPLKVRLRVPADTVGWFRDYAGGAKPNDPEEAEFPRTMQVLFLSPAAESETPVQAPVTTLDFDVEEGTPRERPVIVHESVLPPLTEPGVYIMRLDGSGFPPDVVPPSGESIPTNFAGYITVVPAGDG